MSNIFVKNFFINVLKNANKNKFSDKIEFLRKNLLENKDFVTVNELGAGSKVNNSNQRKVSDIAKYSLSSKSKCEFLSKIVEFASAKNVLEVGTSLGICTLYLYFSKNNPKVTTVEGVESIANIARNNFNKFSANIRLHLSDFDSFFQNLPESDQKFDFVYIDGNHTKDATLRYFEIIKKVITNNSVIIFDDIRWSKGMYEAWKQIISSNFNGYVIETLKTGVLFIDNSLKNKSFCRFLRLY